MKLQKNYVVDVKGARRTFASFEKARKYYHSFLIPRNRIMFTRGVLTSCDFIQNGDVKIYYRGGA